MLPMLKIGHRLEVWFHEIRGRICAIFQIKQLALPEIIELFVPVQIYSSLVLWFQSKFDHLKSRKLNKSLSVACYLEGSSIILIMNMHHAYTFTSIPHVFPTPPQSLSR